MRRIRHYFEYFVRINSLIFLGSCRYQIKFREVERGWVIVSGSWLTEDRISHPIKRNHPRENDGMGWTQIPSQENWIKFRKGLLFWVHGYSMTHTVWVIILDIGRFLRNLGRYKISFFLENWKFRLISWTWDRSAANWIR